MPRYKRQSPQKKALAEKLRYRNAKAKSSLTKPDSQTHDQQE